MRLGCESSKVSAVKAGGSSSIHAMREKRQREPGRAKKTEP